MIVCLLGLPYGLFTLALNKLQIVFDDFYGKLAWNWQKAPDIIKDNKKQDILMKARSERWKIYLIILWGFSCFSGLGLPTSLCYFQGVWRLCSSTMALTYFDLLEIAGKLTVGWLEIFVRLSLDILDIELIGKAVQRRNKETHNIIVFFIDPIRLRTIPNSIYI